MSLSDVGFVCLQLEALAVCETAVTTDVTFFIIKIITKVFSYALICGSKTIIANRFSNGFL